MKRKIALLITAMILIMSSFAMVYATTYTSTAKMNGNSTLTGKTRSYSAGTHKISIKVKTTGGNGSNPVTVALYKKSLVSNKQKGKKTIDLKAAGKTYSATYSSQAKGKYYYYFNTARAYAWSSDKVVMKSY